MTRKRGTAAAVAGFSMCLGPFVAAAGDMGAMELSTEAGSRGGVAASCGINVGTFVERVEALLRKEASNEEESAKLIGNFKKVMAETKRAELAGRTMNCENAKGEFAALAINKPGWTPDREDHGIQ